jgi:sugar/nucleoside kinase (ribokinase family)
MTSRKYDVYAVGHALVDIQARIPDRMLHDLQYGKGLMTLVDEAAQQQVLNAVQGVPIHRCAGGSAANTVIGLADFGGRGAFAGKVANDSLGRFFLEDMRKIGVKVEVAPSASGQTGTSVILITEDAQRTMLTNLGTSSTVTDSDISADEVRQSRYVYIEGYLFTGDATKAAAYRAMDLAREYGVKVAFTVSDPFLISICREEFWTVIRERVDLLFCNLEEARSLTGQHDPIDAAKVIHDHCENVALTLGGNGSILMHAGEVIPIEGVPIDPLDTTGAGDMYAGALLYGITQGMSWRQAGHLASHAAARVVAQLGARLSRKFTTDEVRRLMA